MAFFNWGWLTKWFQHQVEKSENIKIEAQLKKDGVIQADGSIKVDAAFDAELNALNQELNSAEADADAELDALEKEQ